MVRLEQGRRATSKKQGAWKVNEIESQLWSFGYSRRRIDVCLASRSAIRRSGERDRRGQTRHSRFYGPLNINDSQAIAKRFEEKYPFIKVEILRMSAEPLLNRIITEDKAGRNVVDVINNTVINAVKKARLLQPYRSPEHAEYPGQFKDPKGYWANIHNNYYVLGYNSRLLSAAEAPRDWWIF